MRFLSMQRHEGNLVVHVSQPDPWMPPGLVPPDKNTLEDNIALLGDELAAVSDQLAPQEPLVLDFSDVQYMASSFVGKLMALRKKCLKNGNPLSIINVAPEINGAFSVLKLKSLFDIREVAP